MDPSSSTANENTKKRPVSSEEKAQEVQDGSKRSCPNSSPLPTGFGYLTSRCSTAIWKQHGPQILQEVFEEMEKMQACGLDSLSTSPSYGPDTPLGHAIGVVVNRFIVEKGPTLEHESRQQVSKELDGIAQHQLMPPLPQTISCNQHERGPGCGAWKLRLRFCNTITNVLYHKDEIKAIDDEPLKFEICDFYYNTIISTGLLSSAPVQIFLFELENDSTKPPTLISTDKLMELLSFNVVQQHRLQNGIGYVKDLIVKPSSYWISKKFYLVVKVMDEQILMETGAMIEDATSEPFTVKTKRMKGFEKHNPPTMESEVWRLVGISKRGVYHRILSEEQGIRNVGDFLRKYHEMGSQALKESLGERMSMELWKKIVEHAKTCVGYDPTHYHQIFQANDHHADSIHNSQVHNPQNQSVEDNNNNLVETEQLANSNYNSQVHTYQNKGVETNYSVENEEEANSNNNNLEVYEEKKNGGSYEEWSVEKLLALM